MKIGKCKYCRLEKPLAESHLIPRAIFDLYGVDGEVVMVTSRIVGFTGRQRKYPLLCAECDGSLSRDGEDWTIPLLADKQGGFPLYDLLTRVPPDCADSDVAGYAVARNPDINVQKLTHFALGIFWKASVHSWRGGEVEDLIELGPYSDEIRMFLRGDGPFPKHVALAVGVLPKPVRQLSFSEPYHGTSGAFRNFFFYLPGIIFSLSVGNRIGDVKESCFYSNALHPIIVSDIADDIQGVTEKVAKNARFSKRLIDQVRSRGPR